MTPSPAAAVALPNYSDCLSLDPVLLSLVPNFTSAPLFAEVPRTPLTSASLVPELYLPRAPNFISPPSLEAEAPLALEVVASVFFSSPGLADILPEALDAAAPAVGCRVRRLAVCFASSPAPATDLLPAVSLEVAAAPALPAVAPALCEVLVGVLLFASATLAFSSYWLLSFCCFARSACFFDSAVPTAAVGLASRDGG